MKRSLGRKFRSIKAPQRGIKRRPSHTLLSKGKQYYHIESEMHVIVLVN